MIYGGLRCYALEEEMMCRCTDCKPFREGCPSVERVVERDPNLCRTRAHISTLKPQRRSIWSLFSKAELAVWTFSPQAARRALVGNLSSWAAEIVRKTCSWYEASNLAPRSNHPVSCKRHWPKHGLEVGTLKALGQFCLKHELEDLEWSNDPTSSL